MWALFGFGAIIAAILGIIFASNSKSGQWLAFLSLALTAFTACAFYSDAAKRALCEDWSGLMDILPGVSKALWLCVAVSAIINGISLFIANRKRA